MLKTATKLGYMSCMELLYSGQYLVKVIPNQGYFLMNLSCKFTSKDHLHPNNIFQEIMDKYLTVIASYRQEYRHIIAKRFKK